MTKFATVFLALAGATIAFAQEAPAGDAEASPVAPASPAPSSEPTVQPSKDEWQKWLEWANAAKEAGLPPPPMGPHPASAPAPAPKAEADEREDGFFDSMRRRWASMRGGRRHRLGADSEEDHEEDRDEDSDEDDRFENDAPRDHHRRPRRHHHHHGHHGGFFALLGAFAAGVCVSCAVVRVRRRRQMRRAIRGGVLPRAANDPEDAYSPGPAAYGPVGTYPPPHVA